MTDAATALDMAQPASPDAWHVDVQELLELAHLKLAHDCCMCFKGYTVQS